MLFIVMCFEMQVVKPKRCARSFGKFCDLDNDERLSRQEWSNCLSTGGMNREFLFIQDEHRTCIEPLIMLRNSLVA